MSWSRIATVGVTLALSIPLTARAAPPQDPATESSQEPEPASVAAPEPMSPSLPKFAYGTMLGLDDISNDLFAWAQSVIVNGEVGDNVFAAGQLVTLDSGRVDGDLFAFAASTTVDGEVMGDVYSFSSETRISRDAIVHGNVMAFSGSLRVDGTVAGAVKGSGGLVIVSGDVGSIDMETSSLNLSDGAHVRGDLTYRSSDEAKIAGGATIDGVTEWKQHEDEDEESSGTADEKSTWSLWSVGWTVWGYLAKLIVGVAFLLLGGAGARLPARCLRRQPAPGLGFGFVVAVVVPISCLVAIVLIVALPLGIIGLLLFGLTAYLAALVTAQFVGDWILRATSGGQPSEYLALAIGLALLTVFGWIPYAGFLLRLAAMILGIGGIFLALRERGFPWTGTASVAPAAPAS